MKRVAGFCLFISAFSGPALAQDIVFNDAIVRDCFASAEAFDTSPICLGAASNDCQTNSAGGSTTPGIDACVNAETAIWDELLNESYRIARETLKEQDASGGTISRVDALRDAQRAWIAFRDADCALGYARWQDGTLRSVVSSNCFMVMTAERALMLRDVTAEGM